MLALALILALAFLASIAAATFSNDHLAFRSYLKEHSIDVKDHEFNSRLAIFSENLRVIDEFNSRQDTTVKMGVTQFTHMSTEEFQEYVARGKPKQPRPDLALGSKHMRAADVTLPSSVDWSTSGAVTPVKNQGSCGSCWTFAATGALEGAYYIARGNITYSVSSANGFKGFSEQQLNACNFFSDGCDGGWAESGFIWASMNGGVTTEARYPYAASNWATGVKYTCNSDVVSNPLTAPIAANPFTWVSQSVDDIMSAVAQQPVAIAIDASSSVFQNYKSGVITSDLCGIGVNHAVLAVGYGTLNGVNYWKVKNSWGPTWGLNGYVLIERSDKNVCGVLSSASYPNIMPKSAPFPTMSPTLPPSQVSTFTNFVQTTAYSLAPSVGNLPQLIALDGASMTGIVFESNVVPSVTCKSRYWTQTSTVSVWFSGAVYKGTAYLVGLAIVASGANSYIKYAVTNENGVNYPMIFSIPYNLPTLSCDAINQMENSARYMKDCFSSKDSWCPGYNYATTNDGDSIGVKLVKYHLLTPTAAPTASPSYSHAPTAAPTFAPSAVPTTATPTADPTYQPTMEPTMGAISTIEVVQTLKNVTSFGSDAEKNVFTETVAGVLSSFSKAITEINIVSIDGVAVPSSRRSLLATALNATIGYNVLFMAGQMQMSKQAASGLITNALYTSVQNNAFTTLLQANAASNNVPSLAYASAGTITASLVTEPGEIIANRNLYYVALVAIALVGFGIYYGRHKIYSCICGSGQSKGDFHPVAAQPKASGVEMI